MKWLLLTLLLLGCSQLPEDTHTKLARNLATNEHTFTTTYTTGGQESTLYYDQGKLRIDRTIADRATQLLILDKSYLCSETCTETEDSILLFLGIHDPYDPPFDLSTATRAGTKTVAEHETNCYTTLNQDSPLTTCFGPDGQPFWKENNGNVLFEVLSYEPQVPDDIFSPPAPLKT